MSLQDPDELLRRVRFADHLKRGVVFWRAFKDGDLRLSFTLRDAELKTDRGVQSYRDYFSERIGAPIPAILWFACNGLKSIVPPLEPREDQDATDTVYGHLHCSTDAPENKEHMEKLAKLANDGRLAGILHQWDVK